MNVTVVTTKRYYETARRIAGQDAEVWIPNVGLGPDEDETLRRSLGADLLMLFLHPSADGQALCNDAGHMVLTADQLRGLDLQESVVFLGACYGTENTAIRDALREAGARAIVLGPGVNVGGIDGFAGADVLAAAFRASLATLPVRAAWMIARLYAQIAAWRGVPGAEDALEYELLTWDGGEFKRKLRTIAGSLVGLILLFWSIIAGNPGARDLTFFSSIVNPPTPISRWDKKVYVNGTNQPLVETYFTGGSQVTEQATIDLQAGDALSITDWITPSSSTNFTLVEQWDSSVLTLTTWTTATGGSVATGAGVLTWSVTSALTTPYGITKTWTAATSWTTAVITEQLTTSSSTTVTVPIARVTPTNTPTPVATFTPFYTAQPWVETPYPTATPCVGFGCAGNTSSIAYTTYFPIIFRNYEP